MKAIDLEDDVYDYLRQQQTTFSGETASEILRRLLNLAATKPNNSSMPDRTQPAPTDVWKRWGLQEKRDEIQRDGRKKVVWDFLNGPEFHAERLAVGKFLVLLALLHRENRDEFAAILGISGRSRKYFAKTESELEQSGTSVNPKKIPGSEYWVVTNNSTQSKSVLLFQVLRILGYGDAFAGFVATHVN
jgi:negative modulator of initiation of replication